MPPVVVDLGSKVAGSANYFLQTYSKTFPELVGLKPGDFLCIDCQEHFRAPALAAGFRFQLANVVTTPFSWPAAKVYLACNFLEHLPSIEDANNVMRRVLEVATVGVWLRMPSFESAEDSLLEHHGLKFVWRDWKCHRTKYQLSHLHGVLSEFPSWRVDRIYPSHAIKDSTHSCLIPRSASPDSMKYEPSMGRKPVPPVKFNPPLTAELEIILRRTR